ncbi:stage V sporulation protein B [Clostridium amazonitimonense]|uniref:stage V sporulation protein B n=1 Tax=Clostridium amazonitimonense TaxID=1499689 RepID=UPI0005094E7A|nr:stage V sporulation protein B [Clostridium amazonitimonense]
MVKDRFYRDSFTLTLSNLTTGVLGFMFSIILSRELGPEGMGLYGLIMPIYNLFICLICGGIIVAISKISAIYKDNNDIGNLKNTIKATMKFDFLWSFIIVLLVFIFAPFLGEKIIKDTRTIYAIRITCPAMIFIALSNILKGYFYGTSSIKIPAFIDILEKFIRIIIILFIVNYFKLSTITQTVSAAYVALCFGEFISLALLYIYYKRSTRKLSYVPKKTEGRAQLLFDVLVISLPLCLNGFISTALGALSTLILPRRLMSSGFQYSEALSTIGKFTGMTLNIVFFPMIVISSIVTVLIPDLSQSVNRKDTYFVENRILEVLRISFILGLATVILCISIPEYLGKMFFKRDDLTTYIKFASLSAPILYCSSTTYGILNGLGKQNTVLRNSLVTSLFELVSLYILTGIKSINIFGYGITMMMSSIVSIILNLKEIKKYYSLNISIINIFIYILISLLFYFNLIILKTRIPDSLNQIKNLLLILVGFSSFFLSIIFTPRKHST